MRIVLSHSVVVLDTKCRAATFVSLAFVVSKPVSFCSIRLVQLARIPNLSKNSRLRH